MEEELQLRSELGGVARAFVAADDHLREANTRLKPFRQEKREAKESLLELMVQHKTPELSLGDYGCDLALREGKRKRRPSPDEILDRCVERSGGSQARGKELFDFLLEPVVEETLSLRRKNHRRDADDE